MALASRALIVVPLALIALAAAPAATSEGALHGHDSGCNIFGQQRSCWDADTVAQSTTTPSGVWNSTWHTNYSWTYELLSGEFLGTVHGNFTTVVHSANVTVSHQVGNNRIRLGSVCNQKLNVQIVDGVVRHSVDTDCQP